MRCKTASEVICQNFKVSHQTIFQDYKCSLKASFTFFGRLYIGEEHVMFCSNMFGMIKQCVIPIDAIVKVVELTQTSLLITAKVNALENEFFFSGFKNSNAFKLINALWKKEKIASEVLVSNQEEDGLEGQRVAGNLKIIDAGNVEANFFNPQLVQTEKQKMAEFSLPCSVDQFYTFFLDDKATVYSRRKHLEAQLAQRIVVTQWRRNEEVQADVREISAQIRVKGVPFISQASMSQVWVVKRIGTDITLKIITQMGDIPFSSVFNCEQNITVSKDGDTKCKFIAQVAIIFNKHSYMKNTILTRTFGDIKEDYQFWINNVKQILEGFRKQQDAQSKLDKKKSNRIEYEDNRKTSQPRNQQTMKTLSEVRLAPTRDDLQLKVEYEYLQQNVNKISSLLLLLIVICTLSLLLSLFRTNVCTCSSVIIDPL